jgi:2-iminobutanoate/2-iminopropanoate deaminase
MPREVRTETAPAARGHYAQAIQHEGLVYVSGQLPIDAVDDGRRIEGFDAQARQVIANVLAILEAAGSSRDRLLKVTVYVVGIEHWPRFNAIYAEMIGNHRPARTVVPVAELHHGYLVEMDAIAALRDS